MAFHNLQLHLACQYIKLCVLIRHIFCKILAMICINKQYNADLPRKAVSKTENPATLR